MPFLQTIEARYIHSHIFSIECIRVSVVASILDIEKAARRGRLPSALPAGDLVMLVEARIGTYHCTDAGPLFTLSGIWNEATWFPEQLWGIERLEIGRKSGSLNVMTI